MHASCPPHIFQALLYVDSARALSANQGAFIVNLTIAYTVIVSFVVLSIFVPRISSIELELQRRRGLLLLLSPQLLKGLPYAQRMVQDALADMTEDLADDVRRK
jgi:hypothetical protein